MTASGQVGPYALGALITETATARIHASEDAGGPVIVKIFKSASPAVIQEVQARAQAMTALQFEHVLPVLQAAVHDGNLVVVRPRLRALTLGEFAEQARASRRPVPHGLAVKLVVDVVTGLVAAHGARTTPQGVPYLTHGEVGPDHVLVAENGRVLLLGLETPRGSSPDKPAAARFDFSGACALLYDLLAPRKNQNDAVPAPPIPPEFAALLTAAMGIGGTSKYPNAQALKDALLATAKSAHVSVQSTDDVATFTRRLLDAAGVPAVAPRSELPSSPRRPEAPPAVTAPPPVHPVEMPPPPTLPEMPVMAAPTGSTTDIFNSPRPVTGIFSLNKKAPRIGDILRDRGLLTEENLERALGLQKTTRMRLGEILLDENMIDEGHLADALAELSDQARGDDDALPHAEISEFITATIPVALALGKRLMPLMLDASTGMLALAVTDPFDTGAVRQVQLLLGATGVEVQVVRRSTVDALIAKAYDGTPPAPRVAVTPAPLEERTEPRMTLPPVDVRAPAPPAPAPPPPAPSFGKPVTPQSEALADQLVLLCEPDPMLSAAIVTRLRTESLKVKVVADGLQARQIVEKERPAAVISELALPKVDGFNLLLGLRSRDATRDVPVFLMTSRFDDAQSTKALELGADDILAKPLNVELLVSKLRRAMGRYLAMERSRLDAEKARQAVGAAAVAAASAAAAAVKPPPPSRFEPTGVLGTLAQMGLAEIVQSLELGRKTAIVTLMFQDAGEGVVHFVDGEVIHAAFGGQAGTEAFYDLARRREGLFKIHYGGADEEQRTINVSTTFLLLEAMRRLDEEKAGG